MPTYQTNEEWITKPLSKDNDDLLSSISRNHKNKSLDSFRQILIGGRPVTVVPDREALESFVERVAYERSFHEEQRAFYVCDLGDVIRKYQTWTELLPGVTPYYAVKCNNDPVILSVLARLGAGFDCASKNEIQKSLEWNDVPISPRRIVYANPVKDCAYIRYACNRGVDLMTFDSEGELSKVKANHRGAHLIVRIVVPWSSGTDAKTSEVSMEEKFGCDPNEAVRLVLVAHGLGLRVVGVSFYAGHRCYNSTVYERAIKASKFVFDSVLSAAGIRLDILDIGGGFYAETGSRLPFADAAAVIRKAIDCHFGEERARGALTLIAEPGQYISGTSTRLVVNVIGTRRVAPSPTSSGRPRYYYYLNDGFYGSYRYYRSYNECRPVPQVPYRLPTRRRQLPAADDGLRSTMMEKDGGASSPGNVLAELENGCGKRVVIVRAEDDEEVYESVLWGPTCDSTDIIDVCRMKRVEHGDWLVFENMGFYTSSTSSRFNGIPAPLHFHVVEEKYVDKLLAMQDKVNGKTKFHT